MCDSCEILKAELEEASTIANDNYQVILKCNAQINGYKRQLDSFKESTESDWLRINALVEEQSSWSLKAVEQFNRADDLERQLDASQALLAEARAEIERLKVIKWVQTESYEAVAAVQQARQEAAREILQLLDTADWACSTYEETYYQAVAAIKSKFELEG